MDPAAMKTAHIHVKLTEAQLARVDALARANGDTRATTVRRLIRVGIEAETAGKEPR